MTQSKPPATTYLQADQRKLIDIDKLLLGLKNNLSLLRSVFKQEYTKPLLSKAYLYQKPLVLVVGPDNAGKSSLLKIHNHDDADICNLSVFNEAVYIETPGQLIANPANAKYWPTIMATLRNLRRQKAIDHLLISLNITDFLNQTHKNRKKLCYSLARSAKYIGQSLQHTLPIYIIFTHVDRIAGFSEFFSESSVEQRRQPWGLLFNHLPENAQPIDALIEQEFNDLLQQLHQHLIPLLHRTRDPQKRIRIKEFPLQFENMRHHFKYLLTQLYKAHEESPSLRLRGLFFVSCRQQGSPINFLERSIAQQLPLATTQTQLQDKKSRPYFIESLLSGVIPNDELARDYLKHQLQWQLWLRYMTYGGLLTLSLTAVYSLESQFTTHLKTLTELNERVDDYERSMHLNSSETPIHYLTQAQLITENLQPAFASIRQIHNKINKLVQKSIYNQLLPELTQAIENMLNHEQISPLERYQALKAYLMLGQPQRMQKDYFLEWLERYWRNYTELNTDLINEKQRVTHLMLAQSLQPVALNTQVIQQTRQRLAAIDRAELTYALFATEHRTEELFKASKFKYFHSQAITAISQNILNGDWVLGRLQQTENTSTDDLKKQIQRLYTDNYVQYWQQTLASLQFDEHEDLRSLAEHIEDFGQGNSSIEIDLANILLNTAQMPEQDNLARIFNQHIAAQFLDLSVVDAQAIKRFTHSLNELQTLIKSIESNPDSIQAAFTFARQRFASDTDFADPFVRLEEQAKQYPEFMQQWLFKLKKNTWQLIIQKAALHINQQWQKQVLPIYHEQIAKRFPVDAGAKQDISLENFAAFFAPKGRFAQFFTDYIEPFVDSHQASWQLKMVDKLPMRIRSNMIQQFERAHIIRLMFFTNASHIKVTFKLQPFELAKTIKSVRWDIHGQKSFSYQGAKTAHEFSWPNTQEQNTAFIHIEDEATDKPYQLIEHGEWALFHLLKQMPLEAQGTTQQFILGIATDQQTKKVSFTLTTDKPINPFINGIIEHFRLDEQLTY